MWNYSFFLKKRKEKKKGILTNTGIYALFVLCLLESHNTVIYCWSQKESDLKDLGLLQLKVTHPIKFKLYPLSIRLVHSEILKW